MCDPNNAIDEQQCIEEKGKEEREAESLVSADPVVKLALLVVDTIKKPPSLMKLYLT